MLSLGCVSHDSGTSGSVWCSFVFIGFYLCDATDEFVCMFLEFFCWSGVPDDNILLLLLLLEDATDELSNNAASGPDGVAVGHLTNHNVRITLFQGYLLLFPTLF